MIRIYSPMKVADRCTTLRTSNGGKKSREVLKRNSYALHRGVFIMKSLVNMGEQEIQR
jgi:hypothetical protein